MGHSIDRITKGKAEPVFVKFWDADQITSSSLTLNVGLDCLIDKIIHVIK